jgi:hypothetical protein
MDMPAIAPAQPALGPSMAVPEFAPADVGNIRRAGIRPSMDMPAIAPALPAFRPSLDIKKEASRRRPLNGHPGLRITGS